MSTFSGFIPELPGIAVDRFEEAHRRKAAVFFLSHCHTDHMRGLDLVEPLPGPLYLSPISGVVIGHRLPQYANVVRSFNVGEQLALKIEPPGSEEAYELYVRSLSAEHCPGSVMFYFETNATRILYTGDFRLSSQQKFEAQAAKIHPQIVYLDSTFLDLDYSYFPTRDESTAHIVTLCTEWLAADGRNVVSLWLPANYGSEELFLRLFEQLKQKIHISDKQRGPYMHFSSLNDVLTNDSSVRIHACTGTVRHGPYLPCRTQTQDNEPFVRTIRPSALRWKGLQPTQSFWKQSNSLFYVCYSAHASCDELGGFLRYFQPALPNIRFNVIADEADRSVKEQVVQSILEDKPGQATALSVAKIASEAYDDICLNLDKIQYKNKQHGSYHAAKNSESSESENDAHDLPYRKLPKRVRID